MNNKRKIILNLLFLLTTVSQILIPTNEAHSFLVQITKMSDFNFGSWSGVGDVSISDTVCIFDLFANAYNLRATTSSGSYVLKNGANSLPFTAQWQGSGGGFTTLPYNSNLSFSTASNSITCSGGTNATLRISITEADMLTAPTGNYSATISIIVTP